MITAIKQWGNSVGLRIPKALKDSLGLEVDSEVELILENNTLVIKPIVSNKITLNYLLEGMNEKDVIDQFEDDHEFGLEIID